MRMQTEVRNSDVLREAVTERDGTIAQFRELVQFQAKWVLEILVDTLGAHSLPYVLPEISKSSEKRMTPRKMKRPRWLASHRLS